MENLRNLNSTPPKRTYPWLTFISLAFLFFGVVIRLSQYLYNRSLWYDEVSVVLNIIHRSYGELLNSLDNQQAAPPLFLWLEKLNVQLWGNNEYALRMFPLIAGIIALISFYRFAKKYTSPVSATVAIALFATLRYTVYYTVEVKQYASDMMVAMLLMLILVPLRHRILGKSKTIWLSFLGSVFIWLSHPSIFVMGGIEVAYWLIAPRSKRLGLLLNRVPVYLTWLISFGLLYFLTISKTIANTELANSWQGRYPDSIFDLSWFLDAFGRFFYRPLGFMGIADGFALVTFIIGCVAFYRRNRTLLVTLIAPFVATLIASYLQKYPFRERLVLFLAPMGILIIAEGITWLVSQWQGKGRRKYVGLFGIFVLFMLTFPPFFSSANLIFNPREVQEFRPVLEYVYSQQKPGDLLYVYRGGLNHFNYYGPKYGYTEADYILGKQVLGKNNLTEEERQDYEGDLEQLRGKNRVWLLFRAQKSQEENLLIYPNKVGKPLDSFHATEAFVYLYDFSK